MATDEKSLNQPMPTGAEQQSELADEQLNEVAGGVSLVFGKPEVVYTQQKSDGTASLQGGDPDEGGQIQLRLR